MNLKIEENFKIPKYQQIVDKCLESIDSGELKVGDKMPSIEKVSNTNKVAKVTVVKAYQELKAKGLIDSSAKKGFFVITTNTKNQLRVLILFNILSPSKEIIYKSIVNTFKEKAHVDLLFHNYNCEIFENIIRDKVSMYQYFIIMPHKDPACNEVLKMIDPAKLFIIDSPLKNHVQGASSVHQDFFSDIYNALQSERSTISKYNKVVILFPKTKNLPIEIVEGIRLFALENKINIETHETISSKMILSGSLFITTTDDILIELIELQQQTKFELGRDIGIISYNENPLKRILAGGITTVSSDFAKMGSTVAKLILKKENQVIHNPFNLIKRRSF